MKKLFENLKKKYKLYCLIALGPLAATVTTVLYIVHNFNKQDGNPGSWGPPPLPPKNKSIFNNIDNVDFDKTINIYNYYMSNGAAIGFDKKVFEAFFMKIVLYRLNVNSGSLEFYFHFPTNLKVNIEIVYTSNKNIQKIFKEYIIHRDIINYFLCYNSLWGVNNNDRIWKRNNHNY